MENNLIIIENESRIKTSLISQGFGRRHEQIVRLIKKYDAEFKELGSIIISPINGQGRPLQDFLLNQGQVMFLSSLLKNTKVSLAFKKTLSQAFNSNVDLLRKIKKALENFDFDDTECRYVYAAQDQDGNLKIGISNNPERRLKELNIGNACKLKLVYIKEASLPGYQDETLLHQAAIQRRIKGEWFKKEAIEVLN